MCAAIKEKAPHIEAEQMNNEAEPRAEVRILWLLNINDLTLGIKHINFPGLPSLIF